MVLGLRQQVTEFQFDKHHLAALSGYRNIVGIADFAAV